MNIDISLEVYKALTARLRYEADTYDGVIRELMELDSIVEPDHLPFLGANLTDGIIRGLRGGAGFVSRGLWLPDGTKLKARYKQKQYTAEITGDKWIDDTGTERTSPSAAATAITGTTVNGLRFWEGQRPGDVGWRRLDALDRT